MTPCRDQRREPDAEPLVSDTKDEVEEDHEGIRGLRSLTSREDWTDVISCSDSCGEAVTGVLDIPNPKLSAVLEFALIYLYGTGSGLIELCAVTGRLRGGGCSTVVPTNVGCSVWRGSAGSLD